MERLMDSNLMGGGKGKSRVGLGLYSQTGASKDAHNEPKGFIGGPPGAFGYHPKMG
jgi:hypothetical protein